MARQGQTNRPEVEDLLYQALETEIGGVEVYRMAILCAQNAELKEEWIKYLQQTERHEQILRQVFDALGLDAEAVTPGRLIVREKGKTLLVAMQKALKDAPDMAEVVAAECVVDAETKDHKNWQLIGLLSQKLTGEGKRILADAYAEVEEEENEHLYHSRGWSRELSTQLLGLPAQLPPPEEEQDVQSAEEAGRIQQEREATVSA